MAKSRAAVLYCAVELVLCMLVCCSSLPQRAARPSVLISWSVLCHLLEQNFAVLDISASGLLQVGHTKRLRAKNMPWPTIAERWKVGPRIAFSSSHKALVNATSKLS